LTFNNQIPLYNIYTTIYWFSINTDLCEYGFKMSWKILKGNKDSEYPIGIYWLLPNLLSSWI